MQQRRSLALPAVECAQDMVGMEDAYNELMGALLDPAVFFVLVKGPYGSGRTTLVRLCARDAGAVVELDLFASNDFSAQQQQQQHRNIRTIESCVVRARGHEEHAVLVADDFDSVASSPREVAERVRACHMRRSYSKFVAVMSDDCATAEFEAQLLSSLTSGSSDIRHAVVATRYPTGRQALRYLREHNVVDKAAADAATSAETCGNDASVWRLASSLRYAQSDRADERRVDLPDAELCAALQALRVEEFCQKHLPLDDERQSNLAWELASQAGVSTEVDEYLRGSTAFLEACKLETLLFDTCNSDAATTAGVIGAETCQALKLLAFGRQPKQSRSGVKTVMHAALATRAKNKRLIQAHCENALLGRSEFWRQVFGDETEKKQRKKHTVFDTIRSALQ